MKFGFGKIDITPRVGVGLYGFGPYLCRFSHQIHDPLYARALAASDDEHTVVIVSADLGGIPGYLAHQVRERVEKHAGLPPDSVMVHATHTHSGPTVSKNAIGWGILDDPYLQILPVRLAQACLQARENLADGTLQHAVVPAEGIGYNREHDQRPDLAEALSEDYRPAKPELTDTKAHVFRVDSERGMVGFLSYFSCHPVVSSESSRAITADFCGVATSLIEREHPGTIGPFLQGAHGNINTCVVHHQEQESLLALEVIASRYARSLRAGLRQAKPIDGEGVRSLRKAYRIGRKPVPTEELRRMLAESEAIVKADNASDADREVRFATVRLLSVQRELARQEAGVPFDETVELQGFRIGDLVMIGAPFELAQGYKQRVQDATSDQTLVLSLANDSLGYAPEAEAFEQPDNYAAYRVPVILGYPPFSSDIEDTLVNAFIEIDSLLRESALG